jgi:DNA-directed RNA polymerase subunit beta'
MIIPENKKEIVHDARKKIDEVESQYKKGIITSGERYNKIIDIWTGATDRIAKSVFAKLENNDGKPDVNPVYIMMDSGARGNKQQVRQLCGLRGLMAKPSGEIIERPILSSFREGLTVLEYFISTHGARKGLADTALKTADAGYMTRKLCDVAMDVIITEEDCGTREGIWKRAIFEGDDDRLPRGAHRRPVLQRRRLRSPQPDQDHRRTPANSSPRNSPSASTTPASSASRCSRRSPPRASRASTPSPTASIPPPTRSRRSATPSASSPPSPSASPARSSRCARSTSVASRRRLQDPEIKVRNSGLVKYNGLRLVQTAEGHNIVLNKTGSSRSSTRTTASWNPTNRGRHLPLRHRRRQGRQGRDHRPVGSLQRPGPLREGRHAPLQGHDPGCHREARARRIHRPHRHGRHRAQGRPQPADRSRDDKASRSPLLDPDGRAGRVAEGDIIQPGALLAKTPRQASKTKDITGGLPRVAELFEARRPKDAAEMARIDGVVVSAEGSIRGKRKLVVRQEDRRRRRNTSSRTASTSSCSRATSSTRASTSPKAPPIRTRSSRSSGRQAL